MVQWDDKEKNTAAPESSPKSAILGELCGLAALLAIEMVVHADPVHMRFPIRMTLRLPVDVAGDCGTGNVDFTGPAGGGEEQGAAAA